jgi:hypothetical protein
MGLLFFTIVVVVVVVVQVIIIMIYMKKSKQEFGTFLLFRMTLFGGIHFHVGFFLNLNFSKLCQTTRWIIW